MKVGMPERLHGAIREYAHRQYIEPARTAGERQVTIRVGDVHAAMGFDRRLPAVVGSLDTDIFQNHSRVNLVRNVGRGANRELTFDILP